MSSEPDCPDEARAKLVRNERAKLSATYINGVAVAVLAVGGLAPLFAQRPPGPADPSGAIGTAITSVVCVVVSAILHWTARTVLRGLR